MLLTDLFWFITRFSLNFLVRFSKGILTNTSIHFRIPSRIGTTSFEISEIKLYKAFNKEVLKQ